MTEVIISVAALVISLLSLVFTVLYSRRSLRISVAPILIFSRDQQKGWLLENVGNGPALNVVVYNGDMKEWEKAVRCYAIANKSNIDLPWVVHPGQLGATYEDVIGNQFTSYTKDDLTSIKKGKSIEWKQEILKERVLRYKIVKGRNKTSS
jgi:hypothetical protein